MSKAKKVIFVIVEGPTDKDALSSVLKQIFSSAEVHFHVIRGDITTEDAITANNAKSYVAKRVAAEMKKYAYKESDILQIVHLIDTDGAFIPDNLVKARAEKGIQYFEDHIETGEVKYIQGRNQKKSSVVASLCSTGKMKSKIPYSIYYFSRNMEHVLHNVATELTNDQKVELADAFADRYEENPMDFVAFIESEEVAVPGGYTQTWTFIREGTNSLNRHSNLRILFEQENLKSTD